MDRPPTDADMDQKCSCEDPNGGWHVLLVFDTFNGHLTDDVLANLAENTILHVPVPQLPD